MKNDDKMMRNGGKRWKMMTFEVFEVCYYILIKENIISFHFRKGIYNSHNLYRK